MESSLPSGYGQVLRIFRQGFSPWAERSTDDTCSNWTTGRYNSEEMKATDMRTGQAADHRSKSQGLSVHWNCPLPRVVASGTTISLAAAMHNRCRVRVIRVVLRPPWARLLAPGQRPPPADPRRGRSGHNLPYAISRRRPIPKAL